MLSVESAEVDGGRRSVTDAGRLAGFLDPVAVVPGPFHCARAGAFPPFGDEQGGEQNTGQSTDTTGDRDAAQHRDARQRQLEPKPLRESLEKIVTHLAGEVSKRNLGPQGPELTII